MNIGEEVYVRTPELASEWSLAVIERFGAISDTVDYYVKLKCNGKRCGYIRPDVRTKHEHIHLDVDDKLMSEENIDAVLSEGAVNELDASHPENRQAQRAKAEMYKALEPKPKSKPKEYASHYKSNNISTRRKKSMVSQYLDDVLPNDVWDDLGNALKYMDRMGLKGSAEDDAYKCADYLHRAITGKFFNEVKDGD